MTNLGHADYCDGTHHSGEYGCNKEKEWRDEKQKWYCKECKREVTDEMCSCLGEELVEVPQIINDGLVMEADK
ncbi:MAG TPA: hypothetical protein ENI08_02280 [Candidatus Dependentiae bacterium]|nr:hypothetical protein [Candidatus Dependentiae bacterium]